VARDERGRVYYITAHHAEYYYACLYRTGRTRELGHNPHYGGSSAIIGVDIASPYVAFAEESYSSQSTTTVLYRLNVRSGRTAHLHKRGELKRFLATDFGAVVWAQYRPRLGTTEIEKLDRDGAKTLDSGTEISARTLHLSHGGHRAHWRRDGLSISAPLR
jgi:hypothetical protein